jgi:hypothetical protein
VRETGGGQDLDRRRNYRKFVVFGGGRRFLREPGDAESYRRRIF